MNTPTVRPPRPDPYFGCLFFAAGLFSLSLSAAVVAGIVIAFHRWW